MLHSLERHLHLFFCCFYLVFMFVLAKTMYLCRTLGELLRMHCGRFCYRSNNVWFWKEQGLVSFAEMKCQKCKINGAHNTPIPFSSMHSIIFQYVCDDQNLWNSALPQPATHKIFAWVVFFEGAVPNFGRWWIFCSSRPQKSWATTNALRF